MEPLSPGQLDERTGEIVKKEAGDWTVHPNNPANAAE